MKKFYKLLIPVLALPLFGAGCLSLSGDSGSGVGLWKTEDAGSSWTQLADLPGASGVGSIGGVNVTAIEIDPGDDSAYYIGTLQNGIFLSTNYGQTWQRAEDASVRTGHVIDIEVDPNDVCTIYVMKTDRILKSTDCTRTFNTVYTETRSDESLTTMALDWYNSNIIWAGTTAGDVMKTMDGGKSWSTVYRIKDNVTDVVVFNADSRIVLVGTGDHGVYRTIDSGASWIEMEDDLKNYRYSDRIYAFDQTANGGKIIMSTKYGIFASKDKGATWEPLPLITSPGEVRIFSIAMHPTDGDIMYYATEGTFYQSTSGGSSWVTEYLPSSRLPDVMRVHPIYMDTVLTGFADLD
ncbi:hypothetical protein KJ766_03440 [Patescibacteria group bacterium]|nr:hypothetical protein [Patescibacteria group bacterium]